MFIAVGRYVENTDDKMPDVSIDDCGDLSEAELCKYAEFVAGALNKEMPKNLSRRNLKPRKP